MTETLEEKYPKDTIISAFATRGPLKNTLYAYLTSELEKGLSTPKTSSQSLYINLYRLLSEVVFTNDKSLQNQLLVKINSWYRSKTSIEPKREKPFPTPQNLITPTENTVQKSPLTDSPVLQRRSRPRMPRVKKLPPRKDSSISTHTDTYNDRTRASSSEPRKEKITRKMTQSPGIIRSIINSFVRNERSKMYNFTLMEFLRETADVRVKNHEDFSRNERPMSCSMRRQLDEVQTVKNKLAGRGVTCKIKSLYCGIVLDDSTQEKYRELPRGGELLLNLRRSH